MELQGIVDHVLRETSDVNVVVGPLVWAPSDGLSSRRQYFIIGTSDRRRVFRCDSVTVDEETAELDRYMVVCELINRRPPLIIHVVETELKWAETCEALWPGERIAKLVQTIRHEIAESIA